jgi:hypothetical protein
MMESGRLRAVLGCGNPFKPNVCRMAHELPYAFAVGEPVTNVQAPKAKGHRNRSV